MINIAGLKKEEVLKALHDNSCVQGISFSGIKTNNFSLDYAKKCIDVVGEQLYFDYLNGRIIKCDISNDEFNPGLYDRDNGEGTAEKAINALRDERRIENMNKSIALKNKNVETEISELKESKNKIVRKTKLGVKSLFFNEEDPYVSLKFEGQERTRIFLINNSKEAPFVIASIIKSGDMQMLHIHPLDYTKKMPQMLEKEQIFTSSLKKEQFNQVAKALIETPEEGKQLINELNYSLLMFMIQKEGESFAGL